MIQYNSAISTGRSTIALYFHSQIQVPFERVQLLKVSPITRHSSPHTKIGLLPRPLPMKLETVLVLFNQATDISVGPPLLRRLMKLCYWQNTGSPATLQTTPQLRLETSL